jgi:hypothetical protein
LALQLLSDFASAEAIVKSAFAPKISEGRVAGPSRLLIVLLLAFIAAMFALVAGFALR